MKALIKSLTALIEKNENKICEREDFFSEQPETWQSSKRGAKYEEDTQKLQDAIDNMYSIISDLEN